MAQLLDTLIIKYSRPFLTLQSQTDVKAITVLPDIKGVLPGGVDPNKQSDYQPDALTMLDHNFLHLPFPDSKEEVRVLLPKESMFDTSILLLQEVDKYIQLCYHDGSIDKVYAYEEQKDGLDLIGLTEEEKAKLPAVSQI